MNKSDQLEVCKLSDIPQGEMRCVQAGRLNLLVAHTEQGVFVCDEMCTHEDARLCDGNLSGTLVKCPLHGSRFDLKNGKVLDDPAEIDLTVYPATVKDDCVYIMNPDNRPSVA